MTAEQGIENLEKVAKDYKGTFDDHMALLMSLNAVKEAVRALREKDQEKNPQ